jgi:hypothetical protein
MWLRRTAAEQTVTGKRSLYNASISTLRLIPGVAAGDVSKDVIGRSMASTKPRNGFGYNAT